MEKKEFLQLIEKRKDELFKVLSDLIKINSENFCTHGNEKEIAEYLGNEYEKYGFKADVYSPMSIPNITEHVDYYAGRGLENRYNATVIVPGSKHDKQLMLAAHDDTETVDELSNWTVDPFGGMIKDGKIWGRGACDDKYGIAAAWFLIKLFKEVGIELPYDLVFTAYCDEEGGGGNGALAACLKYPSDDIVNLDCKNLEIWAAGSGGGCLAANFSTKTPTDNCEVLSEAIEIYKEEIKEFRKRRHDELMQYPKFANSVIPDTAVRFQDIQIGGNLSINKARAVFSFYTSKTEEEIDDELSEIKKRLNKKLDPLGMQCDGFALTTRFFRFAQTDDNNPTMEVLKSAIKEVSNEERDGIGSCLSDLPLFINHGSKRAFCFGAGRDFGKYGGAHQPDEFIECDKFLEFTKILAAFLLEYK